MDLRCLLNEFGEPSMQLYLRPVCPTEKSLQSFMALV